MQMSVYIKRLFFLHIALLFPHSLALRYIYPLYSLQYITLDSYLRIPLPEVGSHNDSIESKDFLFVMSYVKITIFEPL